MRLRTKWGGSKVSGHMFCTEEEEEGPWLSVANDIIDVSSGS